MPKVNINEIDQSRYVGSTPRAPMVVLVPGVTTFGKTFTNGDTRLGVFNGNNAGLEDFLNTYGRNDLPVKLDGDISRSYAINLLKSGVAVLFARLNSGNIAQNTTISATVTFKAKYSGTYGNHLGIEVKAAGTNEYIITVYYISTVVADATKLKQNSATLERVRVSTNVDAPNYIYNSLVTFENISLSPTIAGAAPTLTATTLSSTTCLTGGTDYATAYEDGTLFSIQQFKTDGYIESTDTTEYSSEDLIKIFAEKNIKDYLSGTFYGNFTDPYLFDFDFVTSGGFIETDSISSVHQTHEKMIQMCETKGRGDCFALLDIAADSDYTDYIDYASLSTVNSCYAGIYGPWGLCSDVVSGNDMWFPPSLITLCAIANGINTNTNGQLWYTPAGVRRGRCTIVKDTKFDIGSTILDVWQNNNLYRVNPIMNLRNYGYTIFGNATTMHQEDEITFDALQSVNVRLIANVIKKAIFSVCTGLSFEYNDSKVWADFHSQMDETLSFMKNNGGLDDYQIVMNETTVTVAAKNERRVPGTVKISPSQCAETFDIDFIIAPSGVTFGEAEE